MTLSYFFRVLKGGFLSFRAGATFGGGRASTTQREATRGCPAGRGHPAEGQTQALAEAEDTLGGGKRNPAGHPLVGFLGRRALRGISPLRENRRHQAPKKKPTATRAGKHSRAHKTNNHHKTTQAREGLRALKI